MFCLKHGPDEWTHEIDTQIKTVSAFIAQIKQFVSLQTL